MGNTKAFDSFLKGYVKTEMSKRHKASTSESQEHVNQQEEHGNFEASQPWSDTSSDSDSEDEESVGVIANKVRKHIRSEVGDSCFCVMVDVSRDASEKERMGIVLRFVDAEGMIQERFFDLVHVRDTLSTTLKTSLFNQLWKYQFDDCKIRGQGYDGTSDMSEKWNGLQTLVREDCPYAYYVHCFAHSLQRTLVCASWEVIPVYQFFTNLVFIIKVVCGSSKRHDELQKACSDEIKKLLELGEIELEKRLNQAGTIRKAKDTRWGSYFKSVSSLLKMFDVTRVVLQRIIEDVYHTPSSHRADADAAYVHLMSFEFVFILLLMKEVMRRTHTLSQAVQKKSQNILNTMELVSSTKVSLNDFRNNGWDSFLTGVTYFCDKHQIEMPDMKAFYTPTHYWPLNKDLNVKCEHYYRVDLFTSTLDKQLHELNSRFNEHAMELLSLSSSLVSKEINADQICLLVEKYYPKDFTEEEMIQLRYQLEMFNVEMRMNTKLSGVSTIPDLCKSLVETHKRETYSLVDRVVRLILTLPVFSATTKRGFSAMKTFKSRLRHKMSDGYLADSLVIHKEKEIAKMFDSNSP